MPTRAGERPVACPVCRKGRVFGEQVAHFDYFAANGLLRGEQRPLHDGQRRTTVHCPNCDASWSVPGFMKAWQAAGSPTC